MNKGFGNKSDAQGQPLIKGGRVPAYKYSTGSAEPVRISFFDYLYVFILIIYTAHANKYVVSTSVLDNPVWYSLLIFLAGTIALRWKIVFNKQFYILIFCYLIYFVAISIKFNEFRPTFFLNNAFLFFIAYATVKALKVNLFRIYEISMTYLAVIGLAIWLIQIMLGGDGLFSILSGIPSIKEFSNVSGDGLNVILYSVQPTTMSLQFDFLPPRNCGFAWEPGGFAVMLATAIFFNLFFFKKTKNSNIRFWILLAALGSSQSTTGYAILLVILLFYFYNKQKKLVIVLWPLIAVAFLAVFSLPFMSEKIVGLIDETQNVDAMVEWSIGRDEAINPQRFASFVIAFRDFLDNPVLGLGGVNEARWTYKIGANVSTITGIGNLLAQYGIVGFLFFIISSVRTSAFFSRQFKFTGNILFFLIIVFISISYGIILLPLMMSFWLFGFFTPGGISEGQIKMNDLEIKNESFNQP
jgi:hypothetical protein